MNTPILNQPWEDVASDVTAEIERAVQPLLKKAVDDIYGGLLDATQDYLKDNLAFNISSRIDTAEREASFARQQNERLRRENAALADALRRIAVASNAGQIDGLTAEAVDAILGADAALSLLNPEPTPAIEVVS